MPVLGDTISGNAGVAGATITLSGAASASTTSAADGTYSFTSLSNGAYVVTPTLSGVTFTPAFLDETISGASIPNVNFVAATTGFSRTQTVSDNFHRADAPNLGANWTVLTDINEPIAIVSNVAVSDPSLSGAELYTGASFPNDQYASVTIGAFTATADLRIVVRGDVGDTTGYVAELSLAGTLDLYGLINGSIGVEVSIGTAVPGDVLSIQAVGTLITMFYNGVAVISGTDSATASGSPALLIFPAASQTDTSASLFSAGSVGSSSGAGAGGWAFNEDVENIFKRKI